PTTPRHPQSAHRSPRTTASDDRTSDAGARKLLAPSQILFVAGVYYGVALAPYFLPQTSRPNDPGVTGA
ncbi:hypothetical protein ACJBX7_11025, partial [Streptococcus suis]